MAGDRRRHRAIDRAAGVPGRVDPVLQLDAHGFGTGRGRREPAPERLVPLVPLDAHRPQPRLRVAPGLGPGQAGERTEEARLEREAAGRLGSPRRRAGLLPPQGRLALDHERQRRPGRRERGGAVLILERMDEFVGEDARLGVLRDRGRERLQGLLDHVDAAIERGVDRVLLLERGDRQHRHDLGRLVLAQVVEGDEAPLHRLGPARLGLGAGHAVDRRELEEGQPDGALDVRGQLGGRGAGLRIRVYAIQRGAPCGADRQEQGHPAMVRPARSPVQQDAGDPRGSNRRPAAGPREPSPGRARDAPHGPRLPRVRVGDHGTPKGVAIRPLAQPSNLP